MPQYWLLKTEPTVYSYEDLVMDNPKLVVIDLKPKEPLEHPVSLAAIKADPRFAGFELVRIPRLSVMPVGKPVWDAILRISR